MKTIDQVLLAITTSTLVLLGAEAAAHTEIFSKSGFYPTEYRVSYEAAVKEYRVSLGKMQLHAGQAGPNVSQAAGSR